MTVPAGTERLAEIIGPVADRFEAAGFRLYLVGGIVRDLALAAESAIDPSAGEVPLRGDIDLTTDAGPKQIKKLVSPLASALWTQGERFGTIGATVAEQPLEITTHRAEAYDPESRKPMVTFGDDLGEDLSRRDFTINAVAIEVPGLVLHDPYGGLADLQRRTLRTPLSPEVSFTDDPLRMMRAARFITRFDLTPAPEVVAAATDLADRLAIVSVERVTDELERLLDVADPTRGLQFLSRAGLLGQILLPFAGAGAEDLAIRLAASSSDSGVDRLVRRAGLLWPIRSSAKAELMRLRYSKADTLATVSLLEAADHVLANPVTASMVRRLVDRLGQDGLHQVMSLTASVVEAGEPNTQAEAPDPSAALLAVYEELRATEDLDDLGSPLSGADIIALLGVAPGPVIGRATNVLRDHRLDVGPIDAEAAASLLTDWWQETRSDGKP